MCLSLIGSDEQANLQIVTVRTETGVSEKIHVIASSSQALKPGCYLGFLVWGGKILKVMVGGGLQS